MEQIIQKENYTNKCYLMIKASSEFSTEHVYFEKKSRTSVH